MQWCLPRRGGSDRYHATTAPLHEFGGAALLRPPATVEMDEAEGDDGFFYSSHVAGTTDKRAVAVVINPRSAGAVTALKRINKHTIGAAAAAGHGHGHGHGGVHVLLLERDTRGLMHTMTELLVSARERGGGVRVLAGGGDGTVAAVACLVADACLRAGHASSAVPVAPLPLGTVGLGVVSCRWRGRDGDGLPCLADAQKKKVC